MTEIEKKARQILNDASGRLPAPYDDTKRRCDYYHFEAICRAIEQHEAFRREVSDAVVRVKKDGLKLRQRNALDRFIIIKPVDPLVEALAEAFAEIFAIPDEAAKAALAVIAARGLEIREKG